MNHVDSSLPWHVCFFSKDKSGECCSRLLAFSPFEEETSIGHDVQLKFKSYILNTFKKDWKNIAGVINDTCDINNSIKNAKSFPVFGCPSSRFNLAHKDVMAYDENIIQKVKVLRPMLWKILQLLLLHLLTALQAWTYNDIGC